MIWVNVSNVKLGGKFWFCFFPLWKKRTKQKVYIFCVSASVYFCFVLLEISESSLKYSARFWKLSIIGLYNSRHTTMESKLFQSSWRSYFQDMQWLIWNNMMWEILLRILKDDRVFFKLHVIWWRCLVKDC